MARRSCSGSRGMRSTFGEDLIPLPDSKETAQRRKPFPKSLQHQKKRLQKALATFGGTVERLIFLLSISNVKGRLISAFNKIGLSPQSDVHVWSRALDIAGISVEKQKTLKKYGISIPSQLSLAPQREIISQLALKPHPTQTHQIPKKNGKGNYTVR